jgi:hypothetical protein
MSKIFCVFVGVIAAVNAAGLIALRKEIDTNTPQYPGPVFSYGSNFTVTITAFNIGDRFLTTLLIPQMLVGHFLQLFRFNKCTCY